MVPGGPAARLSEVPTRGGVRSAHSAMVAAVLVEGFASNISQSLVITGRLRDVGG